MSEDNVPLMIAAAIDDETLKSQIRRRLEAPPPPRSRLARFDQFCRHPLIALLFGFVLTGVVGAVITEEMGRDGREREQVVQAKRLRIENAVRATDEFLMLTAEQHVRAELLVGAMLRNASTEQLRVRQQLYEDAYVRWYRSLRAYPAALENIDAVDRAFPFSELENNLGPIYKGLAIELDSLYMRQLAGRPAGDLSLAGSLLSVGEACSRTVGGILLQFINDHVGTSRPARHYPMFRFGGSEREAEELVPLGEEQNVVAMVADDCRPGTTSSPAGSAALVSGPAGTGG